MIFSKNDSITNQNERMAAIFIFVDQSGHFVVQYLYNSTVDFQLVRWCEQTQFYLHNQCFFLFVYLTISSLRRCILAHQATLVVFGDKTS